MLQVERLAISGYAIPIDTLSVCIAGDTLKCYTKTGHKGVENLYPHPLNLCERSVAHLPDALWAFTFRHPCLPSPSEKGGSKAKLLKISR